MPKPNNIILEGITGSVAYGLDTESSDVDVKGVYVLPTRKVLALGFDPKHTTVDNVSPDWVYHELGKFMKLVTSGNPTVTELLFLDEYTTLSPVGQTLIANRSLFLSTKAVMNAYRGYAFSQAKRLNNRAEQGLDGYDSSLKNRFAKHTRHCFRLLLQCKQLLQTSTLKIKVSTEEREWLFNMGEQSPETVVDTFILEDKKIETIESVLPESPDWEALNKLLYDIRIENIE